MGIAHASENKSLKHSHGLVILSDLRGDRDYPVLPLDVMALSAQEGDEVPLIRFPAHRLPLIVRKWLAGQGASVPSRFPHGVLLASQGSDV